MDNQHRQIKGYRELAEFEIQLMNEVKTAAENVGHLIAKLADIAKTSPVSIDPRWLAEGRTDLQKGFMSLTRSIAQPTTF